jgi:hypothetical protein
MQKVKVQSDTASHDHVFTDVTTGVNADIEKKRKDYTFRRQFNEKPSIIPGCPVCRYCILTAI